MSMDNQIPPSPSRLPNATGTLPGESLRWHYSARVGYVGLCLLSFTTFTGCNGVSFLPHSPWVYSGWIPFLLSVVIWLWLAVWLLAALFCSGKNAKIGAVALMFFGLCFNVVVSWLWTPETVADLPSKPVNTLASDAAPSSAPTPTAASASNSSPEVQVAELQAKVAKWQTNRDKLKRLLEQLQKDKLATLEKLDKLGDVAPRPLPTTQECRSYPTN